METTPQNYVPELACGREKNAQSNHDTFVIPPSLQQYADEPLYILIALWAQQQNDWVSRTDISETFGINDRRRLSRSPISPGGTSASPAKFVLSVTKVHQPPTIKSG
ncbi:TPA: CaiF/GrlA family transcriptional regulator [Salmonella enterica subsp. enterica serovar Reading]